jgi:hypothetical protein
LVKLLGGPTRNQLQALGNNVLFSVDNKKMNMIRGHDIVEYTQAVTFFGLIEPMTPTFSVFFKLEQKLLLVAPVGDVPYAARDVVSICSRHKEICFFLLFFLEGAF